MRLPTENSKVFLPADPCQKLFVQTWYSRVHSASLDTYRVRTLDSLAICDELLSSLGNPYISHYRTKSSCDEALDLLRKDHILHQHWKEETNRALAALACVKGSKDKDTTCPDYLSLSYHLRRLKSTASIQYKSHLIQALEVALTETDTDAVVDLTGRLLTRLINEGYSLEGLFGIVAKVLIRTTPHADFHNVFETAKSKVLAEDTQYQVIVRLLGPSIPIPPKVGLIEFNQAPFGVTAGKTKTEFYQAGKRTYYARMMVSARDERSAGEEARRSIERVMDALRFELIHDPINIHDEFICIPNGLQASMFRFPSTVPNPKRNIAPADFSEFLQRLADLYISKRFSPETKSKVESALHYYRLSLDTSQLQNRLVNSWTALEYLARERSVDSIIEGVSSNIIPLLVIPYLRTLLLDFRETLAFIEAKLPPPLAEEYGVGFYRHLRLEQLLEAIRGPYFLEIQSSCLVYPALQVALWHFRQNIQDNKATATYIKSHKQNIHWHLTRIYGARNDIVHSADTSTRLTLLCANLEYYVKLSLQEVLDVASTYHDINSLEEIFAVQRQALQLLVTELEKDKDTMLKASLIGPIC